MVMMSSRPFAAALLVLTLAPRLPAEPMILTMGTAGPREPAWEAKLAAMERRLAAVEALLALKPEAAAKAKAPPKAAKFDPTSLAKPGQQARIMVDLDGDGSVAGVGTEGSGRDGIVLVGTAEVDARDPWEAAKAYDLNEDGRLDARDPSFRTLQIWVDKNRDSLPQGDEIRPFEAHALTALVLPQAGNTCAVLGKGGEKSLAAVGWY